MRNILCLFLVLGFVGGTAMAKQDFILFELDPAATTLGGSMSVEAYDGATFTELSPVGDQFVMEYDIIAPLDPLTASNQGWWTFRPWAPPSTAPSIRYGAHLTDIPGTTQVFTPEITAASGDLSATPGTMRLRVSRTGDIVTYEYSDPGTLNMNVLGTQDLVVAGTDGNIGSFGLYVEGYTRVNPADPLDTASDNTGLGRWEVDRMSFTWGGSTVTYEGDGSPAFASPGAFDANYIVSNVAAAPATVSIQQNGPSPFDTLPSGTASWSVTFSEDVTGVAAGQFTAVLGGNAAAPDPPVLTGTSPDFVISFANVSGNAGQIGVDFTPAGAVLTPAGGEAVLSASGAVYSSIPPAPAAKGWVLIFMGVMLALATVVTLRRKAVNH